jgi:hypothetical protein
LESNRKIRKNVVLGTESRTCGYGDFTALSRGRVAVYGCPPKWLLACEEHGVFGPAARNRPGVGAVTSGLRFHRPRSNADLLGNSPHLFRGQKNPGRVKPALISKEVTYVHYDGSNRAYRRTVRVKRLLTLTRRDDGE